MRRIERSTVFKRDYRRVKAIVRYRDLDDRLVAVLELLINDRPLPARNRDHALSGIWSGYRDCHLWPDLLLIYAKPSPDVLRLISSRSNRHLVRDVWRVRSAGSRKAASCRRGGGRRSTSPPPRPDCAG